MLTNLPDTPLDMSFRLFRFPVLVRAWFWLGTIAMGQFFYVTDGAPGLIIWCLCVFVSIIIHELGHAFAMRFYGDPMVKIGLAVCCGYAQPSRLPRSRWKRLASILAGPLATFLILVLVYTTNKGFNWVRHHEYLSLAYFILMLINTCWLILNLLPVYPLDGGQAVKELCYIFKLTGNPEYLAHTISFASACGLVFIGVAHATQSLPLWVYDYILYLPGRWVTVMMIFFAIDNYQAMRQAKSLQRNWDPHSPW